MTFTRMLRTSCSEVYGIVTETDVVLGRIDLHYVDDGTVSGLVTVSKEISKAEEMLICEKIDAEIVNGKELADDSFNITFVQARSINIYGNEGN